MLRERSQIQKTTYAIILSHELSRKDKHVKIGRLMGARVWDRIGSVANSRTTFQIGTVSHSSKTKHPWFTEDKPKSKILFNCHHCNSNLLEMPVLYSIKSSKTVSKLLGVFYAIFGSNNMFTLPVSLCIFPLDPLYLLIAIPMLLWKTLLPLLVPKSCLTVCNSRDSSMEWIAISGKVDFTFSIANTQKKQVRWMWPSWQVRHPELTSFMGTAM